MLAQANVPAMLHIGAHIGFLKSPVWGVHPDLVRPRDAIEIENSANPVALATVRFSSENYLAAMIYGGDFAARLKKNLSLTPTEYLQRNVRVSPFSWEDAGRYMSDPALVDVYCFGSDYPHFEGGRDPLGRLASNFADLDPELAEKFLRDERRTVVSRVSHAQPAYSHAPSIARTLYLYRKSTG